MANQIESSSDESGHSSSISSDSWISPRHDRSGFRGDIDWDSGVEESDPHPNPRTRSPVRPVLSVERLDVSVVDCAVRLKSLVNQVDFFRQLASRDNSASLDLLGDIRRKIKPKMVTLDELAMEIMDQIKINVDRCRITDDHLTMLLEYNAFLVQIRQELEKLLTNVLDQLETYLRIRDRGAFETKDRRYAVFYALSDILKTASRLESDSRDTGIRWRQQQKPVSRSVSWGDTPKTK